MPVTTNFEFPYPAPTGKVREGAKDFEELAKHIDTTLSERLPLRPVETNSNITAESGTIIIPTAALEVTLPVPTRSGERVDVVSLSGVSVKAASGSHVYSPANREGGNVKFIFGEFQSQYVSFVSVGSNWITEQNPADGIHRISGGIVAPEGAGTYVLTGTTIQTVDMPGTNVGIGTELEFRAGEKGCGLAPNASQGFLVNSIGGERYSTTATIHLNPYETIRLVYARAGSTWEQISGGPPRTSTINNIFSFGYVSVGGELGPSSGDFTTTQIETGKVRITWSKPRLSVNYSVVVTPEGTSGAALWTANTAELALSTFTVLTRRIITGSSVENVNLPFAFHAVSSA